MGPPPLAGRGGRQLWTAVALAALLGLTVSNWSSGSGPSSTLQLSLTAQPQPEPAVFTRELVADTPWHRNASAALQQWRAGLLPRVLRKYTELERAEYGTPEGEKKPIQRLEPKFHSRYDLFDPVVACPGGPAGRLQRLGKGKRDDGDGGKWLCTAQELLGPAPVNGSGTAGSGSLAGSGGEAGGGGGGGAPCVIYSIGSRGQYEFEEAMLAATSCQLHTFDCTFDGQSVMPGRHFYHKTCLGDKTEVRSNGAQFKSLQDIAAELGHPVVHLLKIDIEGFEYEAIGGLGFADSCAFPLQLSMEVHYAALYHLTSFKGDRRVWDHLLWPMHELSLAELALFFQHMADLGFAIVSREDNPLGWCCSEFTFVRVERPAHCGSSGVGGGGHGRRLQTAAAGLRAGTLGGKT